MVDEGVWRKAAANVIIFRPASSRVLLACCLDDHIATYFGEKGCVRLKGAVRLTFSVLSSDRDGGARRGAAKTNVQKWTTIQAVYRKSISRDNHWERGEKVERVVCVARRPDASLSRPISRR